MNRPGGCWAGLPLRFREEDGQSVNARGPAFSGAGLAHKGLQPCRSGTNGWETTRERESVRSQPFHFQNPEVFMVTDGKQTVRKPDGEAVQRGEPAARIPLRDKGKEPPPTGA